MSIHKDLKNYLATIFMLMNSRSVSNWMLLVIYVDANLLSFVYWWAFSRVIKFETKIGLVPSILFVLSDRILDLCLFVPCFPAFFDLLISLGQ